MINYPSCASSPASSEGLRLQGDRLSGSLNDSPVRKTSERRALAIQEGKTTNEIRDSTLGIRIEGYIPKGF